MLLLLLVLVLQLAPPGAVTTVVAPGGAAAVDAPGADATAGAPGADTAAGAPNAAARGPVAGSLNAAADSTGRFTAPGSAGTASVPVIVPWCWNYYWCPCEWHYW